MKLLIKITLIIVSMMMILSTGYADDLTSTEITSSDYQVPTLRTPTVDQGSAKTQMQNYAQSGIANYLPLRTPQLTPGDVKPRTMNNSQIVQPVFLIGSDDRSKNWLEQNRDQLKRFHAIGILVQADTADDIRTMQTLGQGLTIIPAPAKVLVDRYGLDHYPVLITKEGITQ